MPLYMTPPPLQCRALATDYDGTLAHDGHVDGDTLAALQRLKDSGRRLILVTGRQIPELESVFPEYTICDAIVAENGGLIVWPAEARQEVLGEPVPETFLQEIMHRDVKPYSVGKVVFATWRPHETVVLQIIQDLGLEFQIIFNKGAVMVLPSGMNKATGLRMCSSGWRFRRRTWWESATPRTTTLFSIPAPSRLRWRMPCRQ